MKFKHCSGYDMFHLVRQIAATFLLGVLVLFLQTGCKRNPEEPFVEDDTLQPLYFDHPAWHPAGEWIAAEHGDSVDSDHDGKLDAYFGGIWLVNAQTGKTQPLLRGFTLPAWSPDGKKLALVRQAQIYTIDVVNLEPARVDNTSLRQLTFAGGNFFPAWSPDGQWIVYDSNAESPNGVYFIWKIQANGLQKTRIAYEPTIGEIRMPHWSPDGNKIVHIRYLVGVFSSEVFAMDTSGTNPTRLTFNNSTDYTPRYSPDGTKLAFYSQPRVGPPAIWLMPSDGSSTSKVSLDFAGNFDWSPDGQCIAFILWDFLQAVPGNGQIWLINEDGTGLRQLTHFERRR
ncbi:MAG: hypothetical protein ONA90_01675 [candidate division KSB1 bacterium]|nr:hypothetical protein [candidate division KSB1 bacterium]